MSRKVDVLNSDRERRDAAKTMLAVAGEKSNEENEISGGTKDKTNISMPSPSMAVSFHDQVSELFMPSTTLLHIKLNNLKYVPLAEVYRKKQMAAYFDILLFTSSKLFCLNFETVGCSPKLMCNIIFQVVN